MIHVHMSRLIFKIIRKETLKIKMILLRFLEHVYVIKNKIDILV
jgi:hypothetical protein